MNTKLTLKLDNEMITRIKNYANKRKISLSKFTENIFRQILKNNEDDPQRLSPIVRKYKGILKNDNISEVNDLTDILTAEEYLKLSE